jgi:hypothetical protein
MATDGDELNALVPSNELGAEMSVKRTVKVNGEVWMGLSKTWLVGRPEVRT